MSRYTSRENIPVILSAQDIADVMGISRSRAYELLHSAGFPAVAVGKRLFCPRDLFLAWVDNQARNKVK